MPTLERTFWIVAIVAVLVCASLTIRAGAALLETGLLRDSASSRALPWGSARSAPVDLPQPSPLSTRWS